MSSKNKHHLRTLFTKNTFHSEITVILEIYLPPHLINILQMYYLTRKINKIVSYNLRIRSYTDRCVFWKIYLLFDLK